MESVARLIKQVLPVIERDVCSTIAHETRHPLLFRYPGGKHYAINMLRPFWRAAQHGEYREPFAGGATVFFNKERAKRNWLNDKDSELISTYKVIADPILREKLVKRLSKEEASPERWREVLSFKPKNEFEVAFKYYYLNRTSFSGKLISPAWGYRPKRSLPPDRWCERIIPCGKKLQDIKLSSTGFEKVISAPSPEEVLMYVDPPYFAPPKRKHYRHGLDHEDHLNLCDLLKQTKHQFFLTYDDVPEVRKIYKWANIYPAKFFYRVDNSNVQSGSRRIGFELIIANYEVRVSDEY